MKKTILFLFIFAAILGQAWGATITRYVNTASTGGDGTTNNTSGATAAYASLHAALLALQQDLTDGGGDSLVINCTGTAADTARILDTDVDGFVTSSSYKVTINGDANSGVWDTSKYRISYTGSSYEPAMIFTGDSGQRYYFVFNNIQIENNVGSGVEGAPVIRWQNITNTASAIDMNNCIVRSVKTSSANNDPVIRDGGSTALTVTYRNCIFSGATTAGEGYGIWVAGNTTYLFNCVVTNNTVGILRSSGTCTATNCTIFNNTDDINGTVTITYSAGDDTEFDSGTGNIGWDDSSATWNNNFTSYSTGDFSIKNSSAAIYNAGTDLSGSGVTTDIKGTARPQVTTFDIGAFELIATAQTPTAQVIILN